MKTNNCISLDNYCSLIPEIANPLFDDAKHSFNIVNNILYKSPYLVTFIKSNIPKEEYVAMFTDKQKHELAKGSLELLTKKDGNLMANLINPKTKKIVKTIDIKKVKLDLDTTTAINNYANQIQMIQISQDIQQIQMEIEKVQQELEYDRLAEAYGLQENFKLAFSIKNEQLKKDAFLRICLDAEQIRNKLMLNQTSNIEYISKQPSEWWKKITANINPFKNDKTINSLRENMCALNMISIIEAFSYNALGEYETAINSLQYYGRFMNNVYGDKKLLKRLDGLDPIKCNYWSNNLPKIKDKILSLPQTNWFSSNKIEQRKIK